MKAYCINLDRRKDRRDHMWAVFDKLNMEVERQSAVDGQAPEIEAAAQRCGPGRNGRRLSPGAYACFQSHRAVWTRILESDGSHALIMEDDLVLATDIAAYLTTDWIPKEADIVRLETMGDTRVHLDRRHHPLVGARYLARMRSSHMGMGCYVIARRLVPRLLALTEDAVDAIDEMLFDAGSPFFSTLSIYQMSPAPAIQGNRLSNLGTEKTWAQTSIVDRFTAEERARRKTPSLLLRMRRRAAAELHSLRAGTNYVAVPYG